MLPDFVHFARKTYNPRFQIFSQGLLTSSCKSGEDDQAACVLFYVQRDVDLADGFVDMFKGFGGKPGCLLEQFLGGP